MERKEQIKQAKRLIATGISKDLVEVLEKQFPELAESEDERIRTHVVLVVKDWWNKIAEVTDDGKWPTENEMLAYLEKQKEQKPFSQEVFDIAKHEALWGEQSPAEWSEEDEQFLLVCKNALQKYQSSDKWDAAIIYNWLEKRLKSLRPQSHWKPSEEQMESLREAGDRMRTNEEFALSNRLFSLYYDLEKL